MRIRQQDIARIANVSQATVSRVLAGDDRVEPDIRQRVLVAIEDAPRAADALAILHSYGGGNAAIGAWGGRI